MDKTIIAAFIGVAGTLLCVYIGYLLSRQTSKKTIKLQEFNKAASEFHAAFIEAQRRLDESKSFSVITTNSEGVRDILKMLIAEQEGAMIKFRPYIKKSKLTRFDEAWKAYYSQKNKHSKHLYEYKSKFYHDTKDPKHENKIRELALLRIEKLLSFAKI
jgi:hypothetical protein